MDYPYNGWLFFGFKKEFFKSPNQGYGWGIQLGTTGAEASLAKFFQNTYHTYIINAKELTWALSIPQAFHLNSNLSFLSGDVLEFASKRNSRFAVLPIIFFAEVGS